MTEILKTYPNGGVVEVCLLVDRAASDYPKVLACCEHFAKQGKRVVITPRFSETIGNPQYHSFYASLYGTPFWGKCPDFCVDNVWYEHEGYNENKDLSDLKKRVTTFSNMLNRGLKQANRIVVEDCNIGRSYAKRNIYNRIHAEKQNIKGVYIRTEVGLELLYEGRNGAG